MCIKYLASFGAAVAASLTLFGGSHANAAVITPSELTGSETLSDPAAFLASQLSPIQANGFTLTNRAGLNWRNDISGFSGAIFDNVGLSNFLIEFDTAQSIVAFDLISHYGSYDISYFDEAGGLIDVVSLTLGSTFMRNFIGFESDLGIAVVTIVETQQNFISGRVSGLGNFAFLPSADTSAVPLPAAAWMFLSGLAGVCGLRSRSAAQGRASRAIA